MIGILPFLFKSTTWKWKIKIFLLVENSHSCAHWNLLVICPKYKKIHNEELIKLYSASTCKKQVGPPAGFCSAFLLYSDNNCSRRINRFVLSWPNFQNPCAQCPWCRIFVSICIIKLWFKIYSHDNVLEWIKIIHLSSTQSWPNFPRPSCLWWRLYITFTISRGAMEESFSGLVMPISANYMVLYSRFSIFFYLSRKKICYFLVLSTLKKKKL